MVDGTRYISWYFSLVNFQTDCESVLDGLGDKVVHALGKAVSLTRNDLRDYRQLRPDWVSGHSERGLANWISDRLWVHVQTELDSISDARTRELGATREVMVSGRYRFRFKRHDLEGSVSTYPTATAVEFLEQSPQLPGLEQLNLIAGYEWDRDQRSIVRAVLSLRTDQEHIVWLATLPETGDDSARVLTLPTSDGPAQPAIELNPDLRSRDEAEGQA